MPYAINLNKYKTTVLQPQYIPPNCLVVKKASQIMAMNNALKKLKQ